MYIYEYIDQFTYMRRHLWAADLLLLCYLHTARGIRAADLASGCFGYIAHINKIIASTDECRQVLLVNVD